MRSFVENNVIDDFQIVHINAGLVLGVHASNCYTANVCVGARRAFPDPREGLPCGGAELVIKFALKHAFLRSVGEVLGEATT